MSFYDYKPKSDPINWAWGINRPNNNGWWYNVSCNFNLTQEDVRMNRDNIHWTALSENRKFPFDDDFLAEFEDKIDWNAYVRYHKISEKTFLRFRNHISVYQFLKRTSENKRKMAEKYFEEADSCNKKSVYYWDKNLKTSERIDILVDITLPEKFYEEHCKDEDDWYAVSRYCKLSEKFIKKNWKNICLSALLANDNIDDEFKEELTCMVLK